MKPRAEGMHPDRPQGPQNVARGRSRIEQEIRIAGWREWCALPGLGVHRIKAKLDTGARTSALHAIDIVPVRMSGSPWVKFKLHPEQRSTTLTIACRARVVDVRWIRNPGQRRERRYIILTPITVGGVQWDIELALTARDEMGFRLLLGRTALRRRIAIDPARSFRLSHKET